MYIILTFLLFGFVSVQCDSGNKPYVYDWDLLIFTQHWPNTVCLEWKEEPEHTCILPTHNSNWTVHGIWPTKLGTIGPGFCNSSWHFNRDLLSPIKDELEQHWGNVHTGDRYVLWQHEWEKHGTCAAQLPSLASELLYFGQGLKWIEQYGMRSILDNAGIVPDMHTGYDALHLSTAVKNALGKDPAIECITHRKTGVVYLFEIRICFDKTLQLTDCDGIRTTIDKPAVITNCPSEKAIMYPTTIPEEQHEDMPLPIGNFPQKPYLPWLIELLNYIHWVQWFTL